jgi:hypothetical protein
VCSPSARCLYCWSCFLGYELFTFQVFVKTVASEGAVVCDAGDECLAGIDHNFLRFDWFFRLFCGWLFSFWLDLRFVLDLLDHCFCFGLPVVKGYFLVTHLLINQINYSKHCQSGNSFINQQQSAMIDRPSKIFSKDFILLVY